MGETAKRIISGVSLGGIALTAIYFNDNLMGLGALVIVLLVSWIGMEEFYRLSDRGFDGRAIRPPGFLFGTLIILAFYGQSLTGMISLGRVDSQTFSIVASILYPGENLSLYLLMAFLLLTMCVQLIMRPIDGGTYSVSTTLFAVIYVAIPLSHALTLLGLSNGTFYFMLFILIPITTDAGAYFAGRWFGKHNAGLKVSPKKTYEGYVGGFILCLIVCGAFVHIWNDQVKDINFDVPEALVLSAFLSVFSVFGDLVESALKRDAKKKDSASIIPGHGGILDLADAMLFTFPLGFYYLLVREKIGIAL